MERACLTVSTMAVLERMASLPPRSTAAFPLLMQSPAISALTLGRDSKITPTTPRGTRMCLISMPLGRVCTVPSPIGSSCITSASMARAISSRRPGVRSSRSCMAAERPLRLAASISFPLAERIFSASFRSRAAKADSTPFRVSPLARASAGAAAFASAHRSFTFS